jgi:hypothetical protein
MIELKQFSHYKCQVKLRYKYKGCKLKEGLKDLINGKAFIFECLWIQDEDDSYPGEFAMRNEEMTKIAEFQLTWISSGDLRIIEEVKG